MSILSTQSSNSSMPCVIVHGGAGKLREEQARKKIPLMKIAVKKAWQELDKGKPAEFAVAAALRVMEESDVFNAGYGGYPNANGIVLLDLGFMRGNRDFVSLLNVRKLKFPSAVALDMFQPNRTIMSVWTHELMKQIDQADGVVKERYGWVATHEELCSPKVVDWLKKGMGEFLEGGLTGDEPGCGTVGCVVRDLDGRLAAATSTGGVNAKENGRIGDSPIIGAGVFADDEIGALSTTGHGESLLLGLVSGFVLSRMRELIRENHEVFYQSPSKLQHILDDEFNELKRKRKNRGGGIIVIPPHGPPSYSFSSEMLSVAYSESSSDEDIKSYIAKSDGEHLTS